MHGAWDDLEGAAASRDSSSMEGRSKPHNPFAEEIQDRNEVEDDDATLSPSGSAISEEDDLQVPLLPVAEPVDGSEILVQEEYFQAELGSRSSATRKSCCAFFSSCCWCPAWCCCFICLLLFTIAVIVTIIGVRVGKIAEKCESEDGCFRLDAIIFSDLCGKEVGDDMVLGFDIDATLDLPDDIGTWPDLNVDKGFFQLSLFEINEGYVEVFQTSKVTPVFHLNDKTSQESRVPFQKSKISFKDSKLLFEDSKGNVASTLARLSWVLFNNQPFKAKIGIGFKIWTHAFVTRLSRTINFSFLIECTSEEPDGQLTCHAFDEHGDDEFSKAAEIQSYLFEKTIRAIKFEPVSDQKSELRVTSQVKIRVHDSMPCLRTSIPPISDLQIFASKEPVIPTLENVNFHQNVHKVGTVSFDALETDRTFFLTSLSSVSTSEPGISLSTLQMAARTLFTSDRFDSFFIYAKRLPKMSFSDNCFILKVLNVMDPLRVEVNSVGREVSNYTTIQEQTLINKVTIDKILSEDLEGKVETRVNLLPRLSGDFPQVEFDIRTGVEDTPMKVYFGGASFLPSDNHDLDVHLRITRPRFLWQQLLYWNFDVSALHLAVCGTPIESRSSLLAKILTHVEFKLSPNAGASLIEDGPARSNLEISLGSDPNSLESSFRFFDLGASSRLRAFGVELISRCVTPEKPVIVKNHWHGLEAQILIESLGIGPGTLNAINGTFSWTVSDKGKGFGQFVDDLFHHRPLTVDIKQDTCINVRLLLSERNHKRAQSTNGPSHSSVRFIGEMKRLQTSPERGQLDLGCVISGKKCNDAGAGLILDLDPLVLDLSLADIDIRVPRQSPALRLFFGKDSVLEVAPFVLKSSGSSLKMISNLHYRVNSSLAIQQMLKEELKIAGDSDLNLLSTAIGVVVNELVGSRSPFNFQILNNDEIPRVQDLSLVVADSPESLVLKAHARATNEAKNDSILRLRFKETIVHVEKYGTLLCTQLEVSELGIASATTECSIRVDSSSKEAVQRALNDVINGRSVDLSAASSRQDFIHLRVNFTAVSSTERAPSTYSLEILNGRDANGQVIRDMNLPCIFPNLCPDIPRAPAAEDFTRVFDLLVSLATGTGSFRTLTVNIPSLTLVVDAFDRNRMLRFWMPALIFHHNISQPSTPRRIDVPVQMTLEDILIAKMSIQTIFDSVTPIKFRIYFLEEMESMFSKVFSKIEVQRTFEATSSDGRPIPMPKTQQWWFPLTSTGAWTLGHTSSDSIAFKIGMVLHNPSPVNARMRNMDAFVELERNGKRARFGNGFILDDPTAMLNDPSYRRGDLFLPGNATSVVDAMLIVQQDPKEREICTPESLSDANTAGNCMISTIMQSLISQIETSFWVTSSFDNLRGERIQARLHVLFLEGKTGERIQPYVPPPRYPKDLPSAANVSAVDEFVSIFQTVDINGWSTAWESLIRDGVTLAIQVKLHNPFSFPVEMGAFEMNLEFDDPTGEYVWYLPRSYDPQLSIPLVTGLKNQVMNIVLKSNETKYTPEVTVPLLTHKEEFACRLYNAAEKVQELCASLPSGQIRLALGSFQWSQHFSIFNVTAAGSNACLFEPACIPHLESVSLTDWNMVGSSRRKGEDILALTEGESDEAGAAWQMSRLPISDGFDATFNFTFHDTSTLGGGDGIAFVVQSKDGPTALGSRCVNSPCNGFYGISEPSFAIVIYRSSTHHIELHALLDGVSKPEAGFASSPVLAGLADDRNHKLRVFYSRNDRKIFVHVDGRWQMTVNVWEPASIDTGACSAGNASPKKFMCIDMDAIANDEGTAWVGFTATTGFSMTSKQTVHAFRFENSAVDLEHSFLREDGRRIGGVGELTHLTIDLRDSCGAPIRKLLSEPLNIKIKLSGSGSSIPPTKQEPKLEGIINISFVPPKSGEYKLLACNRHNNCFTQGHFTI